MKRKSIVHYFLSAVVMFTGLISLSATMLTEKLMGAAFKATGDAQPAIEKTPFIEVSMRPFSIQGLIGRVGHVAGRYIGGCVKYSAAA